jgi:hypothetical protein
MHLRARLSIGVVLAAFAAVPRVPPAAPALPAGRAMTNAGDVSITGASAKWPGHTSPSWSGYVLKRSKSITYVSGVWTVPRVNPRVGDSAIWVGIDGLDNSNLIQTGTDQEYIRRESFYYYAWWEILPANKTEQVITSIAVSPGDRMFAVISKSGRLHKWRIQITDLTTQAKFETTRTYDGPSKTADWIVEAPSVSGQPEPLAHYGEVQFSGPYIHTEDGGGIAALAFPGDAYAMVENGKQVSTPSKTDIYSDFNVRYGSKQPAPPG